MIPTPPEEEYTARLARAQAGLDKYARLDDALASWRLSVFGVGVVVALVGWLSGWFSAWWACALAVPFIALVIWQKPVYAERRRQERLVRFYKEGLQRIRGDWQGTGNEGASFASADHPYADNLDLFGRGSLFELLCTARTRAGEETLAAWLLGPAESDEIRARQKAIGELHPDTDLREQLALEGEDVRSMLDPDSLAAWAGAPARVAPASVRWVGLAVAAGTLAAAAYWAIHDLWYPFAAFAVAGQFVAWWMGAPGQKAVRSIRIARDLDLLSSILGVIERRQFESPLLTKLRDSLGDDGAPPSRRIAELQRLVGLFTATDNQLFRPIGAILLWKPQFSFLIEEWRARNGKCIARWLAAIGEFEALAALAGYAFEHPLDTFPEMEEDRVGFHARGLAHPLLAEKDAVANDVSFGDPSRLLIISGSNMSGKSTLLRTIGINTVLALAGAPVRARSLRLSRFHLGTSIRTNDSLQGGASRFYAEITRIRQIVEIARSEKPALFLLDEILHGTNSHDRLVGAEGIIRSLLTAGAVGLLTTHDLALARLADDPALGAKNVHFEDHMEDGRMVFDYKLREGVVTKSNAIELMRSVGLDV